MKKIRFWAETGYVGATYEDIVEYPDDVTEEELDRDADEWITNYIEYGYHEVE